MTRLLILGALGMAIALAPTPGEAQTKKKVPDYFHLLEVDVDGDNFLTKSDFAQQPDNAERTRDCIQKIKSSATFGNLPQEDKKRLNRLRKIAGGGPGKVRADSEAAKEEFIENHPNLELEDDGC